ncbi:LysR substrate-binding domain-containing protein [Luteolibacter flavescens]|uniref:LysR substrate-binding domain-containing protein n=1 Tax=Luteolibacter flavescens TaxID=1859460 RepID=A0ABT3FIZ5_9BACT|nr:LysR substrate-binding domain-containing protein [Luteolibacter flavescens]MCW1883542.1 LysR substrate-binding domain-containing protein [Luteolibacter flavescens]
MDCSFRELECFLAVAEELSFTRAAQRLNLAQPPLSRHIRTLEEKIGADLFIRGHRGVSLTAAGDRFYEDARTIPGRLSRASEAARRTAAGEISRLRIGFVSAVMSDGVVAVLRRFRATVPGVQILLHDAPPNDQLRAIAEGRLDGGFVGIEDPRNQSGIEVIPWHKEALECFVPEDHPLASRGRIALDELAGESFVAVAHEAATSFSNLVRRLCGDAGFRPRVILESPRAQAVAVMVAAGSGIAILPSALAKVAGSGVRAIPLKGRPSITHHFARRAGRADENMKRFVGVLRGK